MDRILIILFLVKQKNPIWIIQTGFFKFLLFISNLVRYKWLDYREKPKPTIRATSLMLEVLVNGDTEFTLLPRVLTALDKPWR